MSRVFQYCTLALLLMPPAAIAEPVLIEIEHAAAASDLRTNEPIVTFVMKGDSKRAYEELTRKNVGRVMEMRIDGRVVMTPVIREPILGGSGQIAAKFSLDEARDIARRLQSGTRLEAEIVK